MVAALDAKIPSLERHEVIVEMAKIVAAVAGVSGTSSPSNARFPLSIS